MMNIQSLDANVSLPPYHFHINSFSMPPIMFDEYTLIDDLCATSILESSSMIIFITNSWNSNFVYFPKKLKKHMVETFHVVFLDFFTKCFIPTFV